MMSYQKMKYKELVCTQTSMDIDIYLGMLESYLEVRKQMFSKSQKSVYNILDL